MFALIDVYNKIDSISLEQMDRLARTPHSVVISCEMDLKSVIRHPFTRLVLITNL
jgi:ribosome-interacting GTPase 1